MRVHALRPAPPPPPLTHLRSSAPALPNLPIQRHRAGVRFLRCPLISRGAGTVWYYNLWPCSCSSPISHKSAWTPRSALSSSCFLPRAPTRATALHSLMHLLMTEHPRAPPPFHPALLSQQKPIVWGKLTHARRCSRRWSRLTSCTSAATRPSSSSARSRNQNPR
jgi:hypothetical protein